MTYSQTGSISTRLAYVSKKNWLFRLEMTFEIWQKKSKKFQVFSVDFYAPNSIPAIKVSMDYVWPS